MNEIKSLFVLVIVNLERIIDHGYRYITGLPQLGRSQISGSLFLGGQYGIRAASTMKKLGITGIVNMRTTPITNEKFLKKFELLHLATPDHHAPTIDHLHKGVLFIKKHEDLGGKIYVHCKYGEGRGPTMAIAYLISKGMKYVDAYNEVKKVRTFIKPTKPQIARLQEFEMLMGKKVISSS